jgi:hypothetical protein
LKKIIILLGIVILSLGFVGCGSTQSKVPKVHGPGEEVFVINDDGDKMYSIIINSVKEANDFEYKSDFSVSKEIIEVDYTYKNIAKGDDSKLLIHAADLQVSDSTGAVAESSDMFPKQHPQEITVGTNCTVQGYYGLANKSDKVKITFSSEAYKKSGILTFEIPVN